MRCPIASYIQIIGPVSTPSLPCFLDHRASIDAALPAIAVLSSLPSFRCSWLVPRPPPPVCRPRPSAAASHRSVDARRARGEHARAHHCDSVTPEAGLRTAPSRLAAAQEKAGERAATLSSRHRAEKGDAGGGREGGDGDAGESGKAASTLTTIRCVDAEHNTSPRGIRMRAHPQGLDTRDMPRLLLCAVLCLCVFPLCIRANLSPDYPDVTGGTTARLWSVRSAVPGVGPLSYEADLNGDYHASILDMDETRRRVSRVAEISYSSGYSASAVRWWNNTVLLRLQSAAPQLLDNITAISASGLHLCLLSATRRITCWGDPSVSNMLVPFQQRSNAFSEISSSMWLLAALRADDSKIECYGVDFNGALVINMTTTNWTYRAIAAQTSGVCGITLVEGDLRCHNAAGLPEQLVFPAPTFPLFFRSAVPGGFTTIASNCGLLSNGALMCANLPYSLLPADQQTVLFDQIVPSADSFVGSVAATAQTIYLSSAGTRVAANERYFFPMRFIAVDPVQGNDTTCACIITLDLAAVASFTACQTLSRATQLLTHANTWLQLLPGTHLAGNLALPISDLTVSSQPPPCFSVDELAQVANRAWVARMAEAAGTGNAVTIDCTGATNCFTSSFYNLVFTKLNFTGSSQHAVVMTASPSFAGDIDVSFLDCGFSHIGGLLKKASGVVVVARCSISDATEDANVLGLIELSEVLSLTLNDTRFERNFATSPVLNIRACVHFSSIAELDPIFAVSRCTFIDNTAVYQSDGTSAGIGGVAMRLSVWRVQAVVDSCTFLRNVVSGFDDYEQVSGGAVAFSTLNLHPVYTGIQSIFVTIQSCFFEGNGAVGGNGGSVYISEEPLPYGDDHSPLHAAAAVVIRHTQIRNTTARVGGAAFLGILAALEITDVSFENCDAPHAGAIALTQVATRSRTPAQTPFVFSSVNFTRTTSLFDGGSIQISDVSIDISFTHCSFSQTHAANGGAVYISASRLVTMSDVHFDHTSAHEAGGAIFLLSTAGLTVNAFTSQWSEALSSGGFLSSSNSAVSLTDCAISDSSLLTDTRNGFRLLVAKAGGAVRVNGGSLSASYCTFTRCTALPWPGISACVDSYDAATGISSVGTGGAISAELAAPVIQSCTFVECTACRYEKAWRELSLRVSMLCVCSHDRCGVSARVCLFVFLLRQWRCCVCQKHGCPESVESSGSKFGRLFRFALCGCCSRYAVGRRMHCGIICRSARRRRYRVQQLRRWACGQHAFHECALHSLAWRLQQLRWRSHLGHEPATIFHTWLLRRQVRAIRRVSSRRHQSRRCWRNSLHPLGSDHCTAGCWRGKRG